MPNTSNRKGANFERDIANFLSYTFKNYLGVEKGFQRSLSSGSFFGGKNFHRLDKVTKDNAKSGDIIAPMNFKFSIECKRYKEPTTISAILNGNKQWDSWLLQASICPDDKVPLLIVKFNNCPELVFVPLYTISAIGEHMENIYKHVRHQCKFIYELKFSGSTKPWAISTLGSFFALDPENYFYQGDK